MIDPRIEALRQMLTAVKADRRIADEYDILGVIDANDHLRNWNTIETAPKNIVCSSGCEKLGEIILVTDDPQDMSTENLLRARWYRGGSNIFEDDETDFWVDLDGDDLHFEPTHWMPLVPAPKGGE